MLLPEVQLNEELVDALEQTRASQFVENLPLAALTIDLEQVQARSITVDPEEIEYFATIFDHAASFQVRPLTETLHQKFLPFIMHLIVHSDSMATANRGMRCLCSAGELVARRRKRQQMTTIARDRVRSRLVAGAWRVWLAYRAERRAAAARRGLMRGLLPTA